MFWLGLGVATGVAMTRKAQGVAHRITPAGAAENVGDAIRELAAAVGSFGAEVRAGMAEREAELRSTVSRRTGIDPTASRQILSGPAAGWTAPPARAKVRARRAGSPRA